MEALYQQVSDDLITLLNRIKQCSIELAEERGITRVQLFALYALYHHQEVAMGQAADILHCDASNVTGIVDRLVVQGLVVRQECERDRRAKTLKLTDKGVEMVHSLQADLPAKLGLSRLDSDECGALHGIIQKVCA